jgi:AhpD family alkylhydroperoxidase
VIKHVIVVVGFMLIAAFAFADEPDDPATAKAHAEMEEKLGTVPTWVKAYPEHAQAAAWEWMKAMGSNDAAVPAKYRALIGLGVASQIPCQYCAYAFTRRAKMAGATDEEVNEAIAQAAYIRHWSTMFYGIQMDLEAFKAEFEEIVAYKKQKKQAATAN